MKNKGKSQHRFKDNPTERIFAEAWEEKNSSKYVRPILDYLLAEDNNRPMGEVTERDRMVAATVIQWLGSPVGDGFLAACQANDVDFPVLNIIDDHLKNGAKIEMQDDYVCLIRSDGEIIAMGKDLKTMLMEAVFALC